jgi:hypothetical protein
MKIKLPNEHYIENIDEYNWALCVAVSGKRDKQLSYHSDLPEACVAAVKKLAIKSESFTSLQKVMREIDSVIKTIIKNENTLRNIKNEKAKRVEKAR